MNSCADLLGRSLVALAIAGAGIAAIPNVICTEEVAAGRLVEGRPAGEQSVRLVAGHRGRRWGQPPRGARCELGDTLVPGLLPLPSKWLIEFGPPIETTTFGRAETSTLPPRA